MEAKYKTMTRLWFICHFFDKTAVIFPIGDMKAAFFKFCRGKFYRGERTLPKLPLFVITHFFYARKSLFFSSLPTHYRGAWGTPGRARCSRVDEKDNTAWRQIIHLSE
jgi:hypothetical protein